MASKISNEYGSITIDNEVVARIAGQAVTECAGVVGMASRNMKDGIVQLLKKDNLTKGIQLSIDENGLTISLHIIVDYGTNISAITENLIESVKFKVEECIGTTVCFINVYVDDIRVEG